MNLTRRHDVRIIGVPTDYGANRRGVDMGPSAIRYAGLEDEIAEAGADSFDVGDISVPRPQELEEDGYPSVEFEGDAKSVAETEYVCTQLSERVRATLDDDQTPLVLGGDHSIAIGSMKGSSHDKEIGVIWFDAHGDFNTPSTTPSGNVHGMPLAAALGHGDFEGVEWCNANIREENVVLIGIRSLDDKERENLIDTETTIYTMHEIDERGMSEVVREGLDIATHGVDDIHVSFDLDMIDPNEAPGVGTPVPGGVSYRESHLALEILAERDAKDGILRSMDLVETNPILDRENMTAKLATEMAASAFGKRIL